MSITPAPIDPPEIENYLWEGWKGYVGWDVGANCGQSIPKMVRRFKLVASFEPALECQTYLDALTTAYPTATWFPIALSDKDGDIVLIDIPDKINTGQLVSLEAEGMEYDAKAQEAVERIVESRTVDSLIAEGWEVPDFLKIDVEGHEGKILAGAEKTLAEHGPDLLIEIHSAELGKQIFELLERHGYTVEQVRHPHYTEANGMQQFYDVHFWYKAKK